MTQPPLPEAPRLHLRHTRAGQPVYQRTIDHHPSGTRYARFNKHVALWLTRNVGSMTCFWIFLLISFLVLPSVLYAMGVIGRHTFLPATLLGFGFELFMTWMLSTCFQLILLPGLMVGQALQNEAADVRAARTFEDGELIADRLDLSTAGGISVLLAEVKAARADLAAVTRLLHGTAGDSPDDSLESGPGTEKES